MLKFIRIEINKDKCVVDIAEVKLNTIAEMWG